jgi:rhodanese-related sulfurtransferase
MTRLHRVLAGLAATFGLAAALVDAKPAVDAASLAAEIEAERDHISAPALADRIMRGDQTLRLFDLRSRAEYDEFHIPTAAHATLDDLSRVPLARDATVVVYSEGSAHAAQAWVLLRLRGVRNVYFLREGVYEWIARVREPRLAIDPTPAERAEFDRAVVLSRFFGGEARTSVPRSEVPDGYWTASAQTGNATRDTSTRAAQAIANVRRRGC